MFSTGLGVSGIWGELAITLPLSLLERPRIGLVKLNKIWFHNSIK